MPNGKPGDHPLTDILNHGSSEYGDPVDATVKAMAKMDGFADIRDAVARILYDNSPIRHTPDERQRRSSQVLQELEVLGSGRTESMTIDGNQPTRF